MDCFVCWCSGNIYLVKKAAKKKKKQKQNACACGKSHRTKYFIPLSAEDLLKGFKD